MNIVFLVGNGFDLNLGLNTRFDDFYKYYYKQRSEDKRQYVHDFLDEIKGDKDWSDFEKAFGEYAKNFTIKTYGDYLNLWTDIHRELTEYLVAQQDYNLPKNRQNGVVENRYLMEPEYFLDRGDRIRFEGLGSQAGAGTRIDVINFNYTKTFEQLYDWNGRSKQISIGVKHAMLNSITHIHGATRRHMVLGVDNESQLFCSADVKNQMRVKNRLIKPIANKNTKTLRDQDCAKLIANADIICVFGMSLGITDQTWWNLIGKRLAKANARLIIFTRSDEINDGLEYLSVELQEAKLNEFLHASDLSSDQKNEVLDKITIAFNTEMFGAFSGIAKTQDLSDVLQMMRVAVP